jgi:hypothetical protein
LAVSVAGFALPAAAQDTTPACPIEPYAAPEALGALPYIDDEGRAVVPLEGGEVGPLEGLPPVQDIHVPPNGELFLMVAYQPEDTSPTLYRYDPQDFTLQTLVEPDALTALRTEDFVGGVSLGNPTFIPSTETLLFHTVVTPNGEGIYFEIPLDLWALDTTTGELTEIFPYGEGGEFSLSRLGSHLALFNFDSIRTAAPDGSDVQIIHEGVVGVGLGESVMWPQSAWLTDDTFRVVLLGESAADSLQAAFDPTLSVEVVDFDLSADPVERKVVDTIESSLYYTTRLSTDGGALAWRVVDAADNTHSSLLISPVGGDTPITVLEDIESFSPINWLTPSHLLVQGSTHDSITYYVVDLCGKITFGGRR